MEKYMSDMVEPVHADSFFSVSHSGEVHERLSFEYLDPEGYYRRIIRDDELLRKEAEKLSVNMQTFLDRERVEINGRRVRSQVDYTDIFLKGGTEVVAIVYLIDFGTEFEKERNKIETWLEEETAPYDFEIIWRFPVGTEIVEIDTQLEYEIYGDLVTLWAYEEDDVGGYERMVFDLPRSRLDTRTRNE
ncbi:MAG: hypothetical protein AM324_005650 [Candidatus Thorarchaeota archaeon SMTZ1-83]|nr:MAG: hypothetical protein AM324_06890 [Candidatus Thorarchaeota archaeon SMTZ1-83]